MSFTVSLTPRLFSCRMVGMSEEKYTADQVASAINAVIVSECCVALGAYQNFYAPEFIDLVVSYLDGTFNE